MAILFDVAVLIAFLGIKGRSDPAIVTMAVVGIAPEVGQEILARYEAFAESVEEMEHSRIKSQDEAARDEAVASLRREWGDEYDANLDRLKAAIVAQPFGDDLLDARGPDGRALFNNPAFVGWLLNLMQGI
jgi:hypothetical protein